MKTRNGKFKALLFFLLLVVLVLPLYFFGNQIKNFFFSVSTPLQKTFCTAGENCSGFFASIFNSRHLKSQVVELEKQNSELSNKILRIEQLEKENEALRQALGVELNKDIKLQMAEITAKDVANDFILIDKGSDNGLSEGMAAITNEKVVVGKIVSVFKNYSQIMLISNKKSSFDAQVEDKDITGVLRGTGKASVILDLIPREKDISAGNLIKTSNITGVFPPNLLVGWIKKVNKNDVESIQQAEIELGFDIKNTNYLFVVIGK